MHTETPGLLPITSKGCNIDSFFPPPATNLQLNLADWLKYSGLAPARARQRIPSGSRRPNPPAHRPAGRAHNGARLFEKAAQLTLLHPSSTRYKSSEVRPRRRQPGEDLRELAVADPEVAFEDGGKDGAVVGGYGEVAALI